MLTCIGFATKTVLGREDSHEVYPLGNKHINQVALAHHSGMVSQHGHALTTQQRQILLRALGSNLDLRLVRLRHTLTGKTKE